MGKTILNNNYLNNDVKSLTKSLCESQSNNTNDMINKNQIKTALNKIVSDLDDIVCVSIKCLEVCRHV